MHDEHTNPTKKELAIFGLLVAAFLGILGGLALWKPMTLVVIGCVLACLVVISLLFNRSAPIARQLMGFTMPIVFSAIGGAVVLGADKWLVAIVAWCVGVAACLLIQVSSAIGNTIHRGWMAAGEPTGWTVTGIVMGIMFYLVLTPVGLIMRLFGRDPMNRKIDKNATTYWIAHEPTTDPKRYFQQF